MPVTTRLTERKRRRPRVGACDASRRHAGDRIAEPDIGLLLPCNVIVHEEDPGRVVPALENGGAALDPRQDALRRDGHTGGVSFARLTLLVASVLLTGCAHVLPASSTDARSSFENFDAAQRALERIEPYKTRVGELKQLGFDPVGSSNVTLIPYPDLVGRLAPNASIALADLDPGIRDCILARMACQAYEFHLAHEVRRRKGSFLRDFLNFERTTVVTGWRFDALVVVRDGTVLFRNFGGEPNNDRLEHQLNPLGPLQSSGEAISSRLLR